MANWIELNQLLWASIFFRKNTHIYSPSWRYDAAVVYGNERQMGIVPTGIFHLEGSKFGGRKERQVLSSTFSQVGVLLPIERFRCKYKCVHLKSTWMLTAIIQMLPPWLQSISVLNCYPLLGSYKTEFACGKDGKLHPYFRLPFLGQLWTPAKANSLWQLCPHSLCRCRALCLW